MHIDLLLDPVGTVISTTGRLAEILVEEWVDKITEKEAILKLGTMMKIGYSYGYVVDMRRGARDEMILVVKMFCKIVRGRVGGIYDPMKINGPVLLVDDEEVRQLHIMEEEVHTGRSEVLDGLYERLMLFFP